jgi:hypothetical protein
MSTASARPRSRRSWELSPHAGERAQQDVGALVGHETPSEQCRRLPGQRRARVAQRDRRGDHVVDDDAGLGKSITDGIAHRDDGAEHGAPVTRHRVLRHDRHPVVQRDAAAGEARHAGA